VTEDVLLDAVRADRADGLVGLVVEQQRRPAKPGEAADRGAETVVELRGWDRPMVLAEQLDEYVDRLVARGWGELVYEGPNPAAAPGLPAQPPDRRVEVCERAESPTNLRPCRRELACFLCTEVYWRSIT
jgi:hypothetical protein